MSVMVIPRLYLRYRIYLRERVNGALLPETTFECDAEDSLHAIEQARDKYPACWLNYASSCRVYSNGEEGEFV
ncbi:hypothetical protein LNN35_21585 [Pseudomonas stutzeri]|jgi:hypothetical protein|uniref:Uncharacterized protein n=1 Tax=Stutzerimonas stutzeri TaxID=316 RepID=A0A6I6M2Q2_STUST|nr:MULTISPECIES: hypothetical protein [Stutzerimonas]MCH2339080.1 hypothetical protein [Pseudomonas sp.]WAD28850.1 hypothetical protein OS670_21405 [Pseudomonadaceae bacterium T75]MBH3355812.1 hypothetical protein [Stutzerimonas stutzeri]MCC8345359.1 hypothetical protein [Stutzerimonas stutzeri]MDH0084119.1 hypothetical protein [Stutzerimonas stutzeri]